MTQPDADRMRQMVRRGQAMPAPGQPRPGRFPIATRTDLANAIRAVGRVAGGDEERRLVRRHIIRRARALGALDAIPETWNADGSLKG